MIGMKWHYLLIKVGQSGFVSCKMSKSELKKNLSSWQQNVQGSNDFIQDLKSLDTIISSCKIR